VANQEADRYDRLAAIYQREGKQALKNAIEHEAETENRRVGEYKSHARPLEDLIEDEEAAIRELRPPVADSRELEQAIADITKGIYRKRS
jgi:hypothetical protein